MRTGSNLQVKLPFAKPSCMCQRTKVKVHLRQLNLVLEGRTSRQALASVLLGVGHVVNFEERLLVALDAGSVANFYVGTPRHRELGAATVSHRNVGDALVNAVRLGVDCKVA